jgi:L-alanine-DL-glutamate epimerase-like enolase superfamily enzyme
MTYRRHDPTLRLPEHWTPEQALAVFECLQALRAALWDLYGAQAQQAWCDQLLPEQDMPEFDPNDPF